MSSKMKVVKNAIVYSFSNILIRAFNFFLLPLYTIYLSTEDYGTINLVKNFTGVMSIVCVFSTYAAVSRFYADYKDDKDKSARLFGTLITFTAISSVVFLVMSCLGKNLLSLYIFKGVSFFPIIITAIISIGFSCIYNMYQYILKGTERANKSAILSIVYFFIMLGFNIFFVVLCKMGAFGTVLATLITNAILTGYIMISLIRNHEIKLGIDVMILKEVLKYSIPLMPHDLSTVITSLFSSIFINYSYNLNSLGLYSMACQFGEIADTVQASANTAFQPWFFTQMNNSKKSDYKEIHKLSYTLVWIYSIIFLGIALFSQDVIILFLDERYKLAWTLVPLIAVSYSIKTIYYFFVNVLFYHKSTSKFIFISTLASSLLNVILSAILIPYYGALGSIYADIIAMIVRVAVIVSISNRVDNIGYKINKFLKISGLEICFMITGLYFSYTRYLDSFSINNFMYKVVVFLGYCIIVLFTQRKNLKAIINANK